MGSNYDLRAYKLSKMLLPSVVVMVVALPRFTTAVGETLVAEGGAMMEENIFKPLEYRERRGDGERGERRGDGERGEKGGLVKSFDGEKMKRELRKWVEGGLTECTIHSTLPCPTPSITPITTLLCPALPPLSPLLLLCPALPPLSPLLLLYSTLLYRTLPYSPTWCPTTVSVLLH